METLVPISNDWRPAEAVVTPLDKADRPAILALAAILACNVAIFFYVAVVSFVRQPYSDMIDFIRAEFTYERSGDLFAYLASPHNNQHLVWIRVLTLVDIKIFHGTATVFGLTAGVCLMAATIVIAFELWRSAPVRGVGALAAMLAVMLIVSTVNAMDCTQPINTVYAFAFGFTVFSVIFLFERAQADSPGRTALFAALSLLAGVCAVGGSGAGLAVWPVLAISAVRNPSNGPLLVPTLIVGLATGALVVRDLLAAAPEHHASGLAHLWKIADYFVTYCGMPWSVIPALSRIRRLVGLVTIAVGAVLLWRGSRGHGPSARLERIGLDLILFALITAAMAAVGRVDENETVVVPLRYALFMSGFQVGLICVLTPLVTERWVGLKRIIIPTALAAGLVMLAQQALFTASALRFSQLVRGENAAFLAGQRRPEMRQLVHPDANIALQILTECRKRGIYQ